MDRIQKYILSNFSILFVSIFVPLFTIASVIFLIKLATYTSIIQLSIFEMGKLYIFVLPELLFFTLPISFFIAATLSLFKLSNDNEIIVLFSLGIQPNFILNIFLKPAMLLSTLLIFNFFILFPHTTILSGNFISYKKSEAKFNLSASEFGHSFGDWLLYLGEDNLDGTYSKVFLFNKKKEEEILIAAKTAEIINDSGILRLKLIDGEGYSYSKDNFTQINFQKMLINNTMETDLKVYQSPINYWLSKDRIESKRNMLITDTLIGLFPILSLFLISTIGIVHVRHQKSYVYLYLFLAVFAFYATTFGLKDILSFYTIPVVIISWTTITYLLYKKNILNRF